MLAELVGISLAHTPHEAVYIPVGHLYLGAPKQLDKAVVLERLRPLLEDAAIPKYGQNIKYDFIVLQRQGITHAGHGLRHHGGGVSHQSLASCQQS